MKVTVRWHRPALRRWLATLLATCGLAFVTFVALPTESANAASLTVSNCNASGSGSLPFAVASAASGDVINLSVSCPATAPIDVTSTIPIDASVTIAGPGASNFVVSGDNAAEVFYVASNVTATVSGIEIENGYAGSGNGGGIYNAGSLDLTNSTVSASVAEPGTGEGGGIYNGGTLYLTDSTVSGNTAVYGGGIYNNGTANLSNSTVSDNSAEFGGGGGGVYNNGGVVDVADSTVSDNTSPYEVLGGGGLDNSSGTMTVTASTVSGNTTPGYGGGITNQGGLSVSDSTVANNSTGFGFGGGIANFATMSVSNSTLSDNTSNQGSESGDIYSYGPATLTATILAGSGGPPGDCSGSGGITDGGYNLSDDSTCPFTAFTSLSDVSVGLNPAGLQNNGGPTETIALEPGSPAIGHVTDPTACPETDQRGYVVTTPCDAGSYNTSATAPLPPADTPEAPASVLLPVAALGVMGGVVAYRRRRVVT
jgi:hypothetical protein